MLWAVTASLSSGYELKSTRHLSWLIHEHRRGLHPFDASNLPVGWGPVSRPAGAGYRYLADQHLPGAGRDRLVDLLDAAPLGRQQEQCLAVQSAEHGGEDRAVVLDALQHLAALADPHNRFLWDVRCLNPDPRPTPAGWTGCRRLRCRRR